MRHFIVIVWPDSCDSGPCQDRIHRQQINDIIFRQRKSCNFQCWTLPALDVPLRSNTDRRWTQRECWVHCFFVGASTWSTAAREWRSGTADDGSRAGPKPARCGQSFRDGFRLVQGQLDPLHGGWRLQCRAEADTTSYCIGCDNCYMDGLDSFDMTSAVLYLGNGSKILHIINSLAITWIAKH